MLLCNLKSISDIFMSTVTKHYPPLGWGVILFVHGGLFIFLSAAKLCLLYNLKTKETFLKHHNSSICFCGVMFLCSASTTGPFSVYRVDTFFLSETPVCSVQGFVTPKLFRTLQFFTLLADTALYFYEM